MNAIATAVDLLARSVCVVRIWKDVEAIDDNAAREMETYIIDHDAMFRFSTYCEWIRRVVTINPNGLRWNSLWHNLPWIA